MAATASSSSSSPSSRSPSSSQQPTLRLQTTRLALVQLGQTSHDKKFNIEHARQAVHRAAKEGGGADMVVLPECWNSPYGVSYFNDYAEDFGGLWERVKRPIDRRASSRRRGEEEITQDEELLKRWCIDGLGGAAVDLHPDTCPSETVLFMGKLAKELGIVLVGGSIPERNSKDGKLYNTATVFDQKGRLISIHRKVHLFDIDIPGKMTFQESLTLTGGDRVTVFECSLGRFGLAICYDMRFPELATIASRLGAGAVIYPGAFNTTTGPRHWELLQRCRAMDNQLYVAACSPARATQEEIEKGSYPAWGHTTLVDPWATVVATTEEKEDIVRWTLEPKEVEEVRKGIPISRQREYKSVDLRLYESMLMLSPLPSHSSRSLRRLQRPRPCLSLSLSTRTASAWRFLYVRNRAHNEQYNEHAFFSVRLIVTPIYFDRSTLFQRPKILVAD